MLHVFTDEKRSTASVLHFCFKEKRVTVAVTRFFSTRKARHSRRDALFLTPKVRHGRRDALFLTRKVRHRGHETRLAFQIKHCIRQLINGFLVHFSAKWKVMPILFENGHPCRAPPCSPSWRSCMSCTRMDVFRVIHSAEMDSMLDKVC